ncbi:MAG: N-acetyl sugar amidotransferase [Crocinitomicaceae bacterium]|nr:N-acetyl sugar amidotransferase [Crocinitomicaceae bacterium]
MSKAYQICTRCVMDTTTSLISFDEKGICDLCKEYESVAKDTFLRESSLRDKELKELIQKIKEYGERKSYDCIIGMSGGMDSSYLAVWAYENGIKPLIVHFDNGWNSELAVKNIENVVSKCGFDLYTYVINWEQFKELQLAYFRASVIDIEVPTDQLILASLYKIAKERNIKIILAGNNIVTETILPKDWLWWNKWDLVNLRNIYKKFGNKSIKDFPTLSKKDYIRYTERDGIKAYTVFDKTGFDLKTVKEKLSKDYDYKIYEYKHYESIFTRFYQGYILPKKFNVDKRKAHLSNQIMAGYITRDQALDELKKPTYPPDLQKSDLEYVLKKWEITQEEFDRVMKEKPVPHESFGIEKVPFSKRVSKKAELVYKYKILKPLGLYK